MLKWVIGIAAACLLLFSGVAIGDSLNGTWNGLSVVKVLSGGKTISDEVPAVIMNDKTYVPLTMLKKLGIEVTWNPLDYSVVVEKPLTDADVSQISRSVGQVQAINANGNTYELGSGFVIDTKFGKCFITNFHVAGKANKLRIVLDGKTYITDGNYLFTDAAKDLYGVIINTDLPGLKYSLQMPIQDEPVIAIGYPLGKYAATKGKVTSTSYAPGLMMFDASIDNGSSGGVLIRSNGDVIGVTFRNHPGGQMVMSEALPMQYVVDELIK